MPRTDQRIKGGVHACQRCRRRKQKCDQRYPQCSNYEGARVPCLMYHYGKQADVPRDCVSSLEEQIVVLREEIHNLRQRRQVVSTDIESASSLDLQTANLQTEAQLIPHETSPILQDLVTSVKNVVVGTPQQQKFLGQSSGISFARMVMAAIRVDDVPQLVSEPQLDGEVFRSIPAKASLPSRHVADHLVDVYFQYRTPHLPILDRAQVTRAIENAYRYHEESPGSVKIPARDMFLAYMTFAIALIDVPYVAGGRPIQSEGCFSSALGWVEYVLTYSKSDIDTIRVVLLLAQFVALSPSRGSLWHLTGFAVRLCVDVGLHWESDAEVLNMAPGLLNDRRRLWHSAYHFDRLLCVTLGRPVDIPDESTRVQLPNPWTQSSCGAGSQPSGFDVHTHRAHNHLFALSKLESEIKHVQNSQAWGLRLAYPRPSWTAWLQDIWPRIQQWYATIPDPSEAHPSSIFSFQAYWEVIYNNTILLLHRPHSSMVFPAAETLSICFISSCKVIDRLKILQREGRVEMLWKSVHHLFMAGLGVIYAVWHSRDVGDHHPVGKCIGTLQSCASTLAAMSETLRGAIGCRNAFEKLSSATIDWLVTRDIEDSHQSQLNFENNVRELMVQMQANPREGSSTKNHCEGSDDVSAMLSTDVSQLLNEAAQWPDLREFDFEMMGQDARMTDTGGSLAVLAT